MLTPATTATPIKKSVISSPLLMLPPDDSARVSWLTGTERASVSPLKRLSSIFLGGDSFVCKNRVTQREPGMADGHNRSRSSERKLAFICQGLALAEVCLAVFERDHNQSSSLR